MGAKIIGSPRLLICDEVTSVLMCRIPSPNYAAFYFTEKRDGDGTVFTSHDLALVGGICDRVCVLHDGQVRGRIAWEAGKCMRKQNIHIQDCCEVSAGYYKKNL